MVTFDNKFFKTFLSVCFLAAIDLSNSYVDEDTICMYHIRRLDRQLRSAISCRRDSGFEMFPIVLSRYKCFFLSCINI